MFVHHTSHHRSHLLSVRATACPDSELGENLRERSCGRLSSALSIASALAEITATRTLMTGYGQGQGQGYGQGQGQGYGQGQGQGYGQGQGSMLGVDEVIAMSLSILDR